MDRFFRSALFPLVVIVVLVYLVNQTFMSSRAPKNEITYAGAERILREQPEQIEEVTLRPRERTARIELANGVRYATPSSGSNDSMTWWWFVAIGLFMAVAATVHMVRNRRGVEDLTAQMRNRPTA